MQKSRTKSNLVIAFSFLLSIMILLISVGMISLDEINNQLKSIASNNLVKVSLASDMLHAARERSILLHRMVLLDDPFERDELGLELDVHGAQFGNKRTLLLSMELSDEERLILDRQGQLTGLAIPLQRQVIDLVAQDELEEAKLSLMDGAMPAQNAVLEELIKLIELQNAYATRQTGSSQEIYKHTQVLMLLLGVLAILVGLVISKVFINKISLVEQQLNAEKEKAEVTFRSIGDAVITSDKKGYVEYLNRKAELLLGIYQQDAIGKKVIDIFQAFDAENNKSLNDTIQNFLGGNFNSQLSSQVTLKSFDNITYHISVVISPIITLNNNIQGLVITFNDVTKSVELMRKIEFQATRDALTGLLNRNEFEVKVVKALSLYESNTTHAFCIIDLDRFKIVNDTCGHKAGDELLKQISSRMKGMIRKGDLLARIGGDEFAVFLANIDRSKAVELAEEIVKNVSAFRFLWEEKTFTVGASIGLVDASPEISDYNYLYHSADTACYLAKNSGRNRVHVISSEDILSDHKKNEIDWIYRLNVALDNNDFYLFGQNIIPISPRSQGRHHVEILLRMIADDRTVISPMAFIPTAERYGLMQKIDLYVMKNICRFIADNPLDFNIYAVNLSGQTLSSVHAMDNLIDIVKESNLPAGRLCLEVTETVAIANLDNARVFMATMQELGCYTALDDFGSGLSSFSYLKNLPLDYIKIDGAFVCEMTKDKASAVMVDAIHSVGKKLGLMTIAEYVEDEETLNMLKQIGVDFAQGFYFDEPELCVPPVYSDLSLNTGIDSHMSNL
jgi:diguanylate cyclase (GGDEF)-like protein/PAS domain S-box-containing protein